MKQKIAVLGGGVGGITAAFALTSTPELRERFDVTVYERGWRLGGKGASGRNADRCNRIEEHGLHVWFGFYDNAFRLMRECYEQLDRAHNDPDSSIKELDDAFRPCSSTVLFDHYGDRWWPWHNDAPRNPMPVGVAQPLQGFWDAIDTFLAWVAHRVDHHITAFAVDAERAAPRWITRLGADFGVEISTVRHAASQCGEVVRRASASARPRCRELVCGLLVHLRDFIWNDIVEPRTDDPAIRNFFTSFDLMATAAIGILRDGVLDLGFRSIDDEDLRDYLHRHGARDITIGSTTLDICPSIRALYDLAFCFRGGDVATPEVAAGVALRSMFRLGLTYRGALFFKMSAGMGDTVFAPYYQLLKRRNVKFEFFHWVTALRTDGHAVTAIELVRQLDLGDTEYDPLVRVRDLDCWPSEPKWELLPAGARDVALDTVRTDVAPITLTRGDDKDFHSVVVAIPVGALPAITGDLAAANDRFARMLTSSRTCMTQAFQLWLKPDTATLGWRAGSDSICGTYVEPIDTYSDMSHLLPREEWPPGDESPKSIAYFCGVLADDDSGVPPIDRARAAARHYVQHDIATLWSNAVDGDGALRDDLLVADPAHPAIDPFDDQYFRANSDPSERYVMTPPTLVLDRLAANESGFDNLFLAGDWTRNGMDAGCVEGATISGLQAARAISGEPFPIVAENDDWFAAGRP